MALTPTGGHAGHGPHVPCASSDAEVIEWHDETAQPSRLRVLLWTCVCENPRYYLAAAGGQLIIIRKARDKVRLSSTSYSPPMRYRVGEELWVKLLAGEAH